MSNEFSQFKAAWLSVLDGIESDAPFNIIRDRLVDMVKLIPSPPNDISQFSGIDSVFMSQFKAAWLSVLDGIGSNIPLDIMCNKLKNIVKLIPSRSNDISHGSNTSVNQMRERPSSSNDISQFKAALASALDGIGSSTSVNIIRERLVDVVKLIGDINFVDYDDAAIMCLGLGCRAIALHMPFPSSESSSSLHYQKYLRVLTALHINTHRYIYELKHTKHISKHVRKTAIKQMEQFAQSFVSKHIR